MADFIGIQGTAAFAKDRGLYGAGPDIVYPDVPGTTLGATHQLPFTSESLTEALEYEHDPALVGSGIAPPSSRVSESIKGTLEGHMRYRGWERLMCIACGFEQPDNSPAILGATSAMGHIFELDEAMQDQAWVAGDERTAGFNAGDRKVRRGQIVIDKGQAYSHGFHSCMVDKFTLSGNPKEVGIAFDIIGYDYAIGSYNAASWTLPAGGEYRALFQQATVYLGTRAAGYGALSEFKPSGFELALANNLKGDDITTGTAPNIVQPERSNFREVTFSLEFPRYSADQVTLEGYAGLDTELAGYLELVGPQIGATGYYLTWGFYMSSLHINTTEPANVGGPGVLTWSCSMDAHRPGGSDIFVGNKHEGIALVKDGEMVVKCINEDTADYITEV